MSNPGLDLKAMNQVMVDRISRAPAAPIRDQGYGMRVLEVVGRHSGRPTRTPIGVLSTEGVEYLVCPDRNRDWPRNVRAAGRARISGGGTQTEMTASEVGGSAAARVVAAYLRAVTAPWAIAAFAVPEGSGDAEIEPHLDRMAVFRLDPVGGDPGATGPGGTGPGPLDSGPLDSGPLDSGPLDSGPLDSGRLDSGSHDSGGLGTDG